LGEIGGFVRPVLWDGIDCHRARMLGWIAESIDLEPIRFVHLRPRGASHNGAFGPGGFGQYFMGTSPFYLSIARQLTRCCRQHGHAVGLSQKLAQGATAL
jgi:hypothetical protein